MMDTYMPRQAPDRPTLVDNDLFKHALATIATADRATANEACDELLLQFLLGRSVELSLKAYLIRHGASSKDLRQLGRNGHDLMAAFAAAEAKGFRMNGGNEQTRDHWLAVLNENYCNKLFEYPEVRPYRVLNLRLVRNIVTRIVGAVALDLWGQAEVDRTIARGKAEAIGLSEWSGSIYPDSADFIGQAKTR